MLLCQDRGMRVVSLWRYPVKSMQGEELDAATIGDRGIVGDRQWALVDLGTGLALTARRVPELLFARARLVGDPTEPDVEIELPDGTVTTDDAALSAWMGRDVELRHAGTGISGRYEIAADFEDESGSPWFQWDGPDGTFHDSGRTRVSILGTGSIGSWDRRRFRGNVLVETSSVGAEEALVDRRITLGSAVLDVGRPLARCVMTTRPQPGGIERDLDVLRTINSERATHLGVGTLVVAPGRVAVGDELAVAEP
jgi:MOSC domain-containing protein